jgi:drug/metabolite transporter (DMT)-like permease
MTASINQQMSIRDILTLIILSLLWGGSFFFVEVLVDFLPPLTIVTARVTLAALALWGFIFALKLPIPKKLKSWKALFVLGFLNNALPFCLIVWAQTQISSGLASILNATIPFFTVVIAGIFLIDERMTALKMLGVLLGLLGVIVLIGPGALKGLDNAVLGEIAVIIAAISYAIAGVYARRFKGLDISPLVVATGQVSSAAIMLMPLTLIIDQPWTFEPLATSALLAVLGLAFFSTVIAYILYFRLIASAGATNAALVAFLIPVSAIILGVTFIGETLSKLDVLGMLFIGCGLLVIDGRLFKRDNP